MTALIRAATSVLDDRVRDGAKPTPWKYWDLGISTSTANRIFQQVGGAITRVPPDATRLTRKQGPTQFFGKQPQTK